MSLRVTAERLGDTVLVQVDDNDRRVTFTMTNNDAVAFGWDLLVLGATDAPALTPVSVITGQGL